MIDETPPPVLVTGMSDTVKMVAQLGLDFHGKVCQALLDALVMDVHQLQKHRPLL